jgi:energy-coupling factor transporter ATP-binding protein EcfA2
MDNLIELKNVTFLYDPENEPDKKALDGISITIRKGEFLVLPDATGSGKSSLRSL